MSDVINIMSERDRAILLRVRAWAKQNNISEEKVQPSYLRVALLTDGSKSEYQFPIKKDSGVSLIHDKKLDQNDSFVVTDIGQFLLAENPATPGVGLLQTYPNNLNFVAVANEVAPLHLNVFYNGYYKVKVGETVFVEALPTNKMLCVRTTQQSAATNFSERFSKDGTVEINPDVTLNGSGKNEITLTVPTFASMQIQHITAATRIYTVFYAYGFLIAGGGSLGRMS